MAAREALPALNDDFGVPGANQMLVQVSIGHPIRKAPIEEVRPWSAHHQFHDGGDHPVESQNERNC